MRHLLLTVAALLFAGTSMGQRLTQDLAGSWRFQLDPMGFGKTPGSELYLAKLNETIQLPGSTDQGGKGIRNTASHVDRLSRKFEYCGQAWYQREVVIPQEWANQAITLHLERCHWETSVYVDGKPVATDERLSTPNRFDLSAQLTPGTHTLTLCVDNRLKYPMDQWGHGTTEHTQTNWNGVVGDIELVARPQSNISEVNTYPQLAQKSVRVEVKLQHTLKTHTDGTLKIAVRDAQQRLLAQKEMPVALQQGANQVSETLALGKNIELWDEFNPYLYQVEAQLTTATGTDEVQESFGMREVSQGKHHVQVNGRNVHLRGALDCCVFPLTGYPSTRVEDWKRIFRIVKDYGLNHVRFHSWCPPEAAFTAADQIGIYLQAELPMWIKDVGKYPARRDFFEKEMYAILKEYGNHPSFILMCNGNENEGDFAVLEDLVKKAQAHDNRRLYSASTARTHTASDQYYTSHVTQKGWITVYEGKPSTDWDRSKESDIDCPVIAHETGQRCMYPNFDEIKKYTGVLEPRNFEVFQERLTRHGMLHQAKDFFQATGAHTVLQYKEVNESLLRTANSGGFQLLGLADFPGQGSAFVGILDAFWDSKGLVTPEKYRESCAPTVVLARIPRRTFTTGDTLTARFEVYHYGQHPLRRGKLEWSLKDEAGQIYRQGSLRTPSIDCARVDSLGRIELKLEELVAKKKLTGAKKLTLHATLNGIYHNEWDVWVYPQVTTPNTQGYRMATAYTSEVREALAKGERVLLVTSKLPGRKARFASHFWNPIMFNWDPMIVGTLIDNHHPAFREFPTDKYADWQWWDILNYATAVELEGADALTPVIQSIDTYEVNKKLGIAFEAQVGEGRLFVLGVDAEKHIDQRPAMRQLMHSVRNYVASDQFKPTTALAPHQVDALLLPAPSTTKGEQESSAIRQLLNQ